MRKYEVSLSDACRSSLGFAHVKEKPTRSRVTMYSNRFESPHKA